MPNSTGRHLLCLHCPVNSMLTRKFPVGSLMDRKKIHNGVVNSGQAFMLYWSTVTREKKKE